MCFFLPMQQFTAEIPARVGLRSHFFLLSRLISIWVVSWIFLYIFFPHRSKGRVVAPAKDFECARTHFTHENQTRAGRIIKGARPAPKNATGKKKRNRP
ncbi:hypothetical protein [Pandoravirus japonicus]|uniref:Uncharacterized protein n=1 Tax=Pandoravirus japonicus TaxID=2823154 RepID=A0A811BRS7_9VIRU|nr:hypothetical protein [Pandoravirus japonicus]